ncbi:HTH domain-containing protein [Pedobacter fastidiosus]|uniref:HTH domain-containing protein n=1 Tax=Pedobacter fastidiosus TaxID=2765361 RepID=A0ABR7KPL4_9SPHI|nr:HTH domain-containing protein [Pedobacter fastidiosus]MBC6109933.1 HTH domain-containing protein [Pedobacter fastidiosus]
MKIFQYIDRINLLHKLLRESKTGRPETLAQRMHVSKSRILRIIEELKLNGVPIKYSRQTQTYYYTKKYEMHASLILKPLDEIEIQNINGGYLNSINLSAFFVH